MEGDGVQVMISKAEIDTTAPFRSVKEAVVMFGERVLGSEVYGTKLREAILMQDRMTNMEDDKEAMTSDELEDAKQNLQRAQEESVQMASSLFFLQQELQHAKTQIQQLKIRHDLDSRGKEDIKFVQDSGWEAERDANSRMEKTNHKVDLEKKKYVRFANPPCVHAQVVLPNAATSAEAVLQRNSSLRKKKNKQFFVSLIKGIFSKKKGKLSSCICLRHLLK